MGPEYLATNSLAVMLITLEGKLVLEQMPVRISSRNTIRSVLRISTRNNKANALQGIYISITGFLPLFDLNGS